MRLSLRVNEVMSQVPKGKPFDRILRIVHEGLKSAKERPDEV